MPTSGNFTGLAKNQILNAWRNQSLIAIAKTATDSTRSDAVTVTFNAASNGKITVVGSPTLTIDNNSDDSNAIKKIVITEDIVGPPVDQIVFELDTAIDFPAGGSLIINQLDVELDNE